MTDIHYKEPTHFTLRWKKVWESADGRGNVQRYLAPFGLRLFDAWFDGRWLGQSHRLATARKMVRDAAAGAPEAAT